MISLAFKMLIGNKASCLGVIFGIFLATLLISQQSAIFLGLIERSSRIIIDIPEPSIWIMDPATESEDKLRSLPIGYLDVVRGIPGIQWAVPLNSSLMPMVSPAGQFDICLLYGVDDATLIGAPAKMLKGSTRDLRREGAIIVDAYSANHSLASVGPDGEKVPLEIGQTFEINGKRAVVVGICIATPGFYPHPIMFTSLSQFNTFDPRMKGKTGFILAKTKEGADIEAVSDWIKRAHPKLQAFTREQFKDRIRDFFLKTGILINFGLSVFLGIIIGFSISGQIFYIMTLENMVYYALIKAVGGTGKMILQMIIFQAAVVGTIGYALGIGATMIWGFMIEGTTLAFLFPWQLLLFTGMIILTICISTALASVRKVLHADPKMLMGT